MLAKYIWIIAFTLHLQCILTLNSCGKHLTCRDCILDPSGCVWCSMDILNGSRCKSKSTYNENWCPKSHKEDPISDVQKIEYKNLSSDHGNIIQINPQRYKLKLRPGESMKFNFSFQAAKNYPVDLYFLLDNSATMESVKNMTAKKSESIYQTMKKITNDVFLGFGTFIDKNVLPMTYVINSELTYSFRHQLKLTKEYKDFKNIVTNTKSGSNYDEPEGGLDALAQVIVCKNIIGWRNESRKIIIFLTDSAYHAAGDARTAGIFQPYDGKCYTDSVNYTKELEMDYPSIGMINKLAIEHQVIILFVVSHKTDVYEKLSDSIRGAKLSILSQDDNNEDDTLESILIKTYEEISKKIKLKPSINLKYGGLKNYEISFDPECSQHNSGIDCEVKPEEEKHFVGTIKLLDYYGANNALIDITVEGISEKLTLDVEVITSCDCEHNGITSMDCNGDTLQCGICKCSNMRYGDTCACTRNANNIISDNSTCIPDDGMELCSSHGSCICGTCECTDQYEGRYCECSKNNCKRSGGVLCGGPDHGDCVCGTCKCKPEWSGDACDCNKYTKYCKGKNDSICNNHGTCVCGACKCHKEPWDERNQESSRCDLTLCPDCHHRQCIYLDKCALSCYHSADKNCSCDGVDATIIDSLPAEYSNSSAWKLCPNIRVDGGCFTRYVYQYDNVHYRILLMLQRNKECAQSYYLYGGVCLIVLILVGVLTIVLWKLLTDARDRREYEKFLKHQQEGLSEPCENIIYEPAVTTFMNPTFRKRSIVRDQ